MPRLSLMLAVLALLIAACVDTTTTPERPAVPEPGGRFTGSLEALPGLTGTITFEISASGAQVSGLTVEFVADEYQCGHGSNGSHVVSGGHSIAWDATVPIRDGAFDLDLDTTKWHGVFDSATAAQGTFWHIGRSGCEYGPMTWEADSR
ncbi:MAG: hypothetical protein V3S38_00860 [Acidimicrobiia bacterium]